MFESKFMEIMTSKPSDLSVHEEMGILAAKVNTTNLELQRLHTHGRRRGIRDTTQKRPKENYT